MTTERKHKRRRRENKELTQMTKANEKQKQGHLK
jgi:hypothetical protein